MNYADFTKNVFVIHLQHRIDRESNVETQMKKLTNNFQYFEAINGHELDYSGPLLKGEQGIRLTHLKLLNYAKQHNLEQILVLEDDIVLAENFQDQIGAILSDLPEDYNLLYLGGAHKAYPNHIKGNLYKVRDTVTLHGLLINSNMYDILIQTIEDNPGIQVDNAYALTQSKYNAYVCYPHLAWQLDDYSDIQNKFVNYNWLKPQ
jgi:GR25 family glycosyltransferase involved in LPS biosynthesis